MQSSHPSHRKRPATPASQSCGEAARRPLVAARGAAAIALVATMAVLFTLSPDGWGPGTTCDEYLYAAAGKRLVTALREQGLAFFQPAAIEANYGGIALHPPLGRWLLGVAQLPLDPWPEKPAAVWLPAARVAPACVFGALVLLIGTWLGQVRGVAAGATAAAATALTPRMFGHAHLAALDLFTAAFSLAAIVVVELAARRAAPFNWRQAAAWSAAGVVWGLALSTRINGFLLAPPLLAWMIWRLKWGVCWAGTIWLATGMTTFFVGWPWLWAAPVARFREFLASATDRPAIHVFYLGQVWQDRDVPWHYPWVMTAVTIPAGILLLAAIAVWVHRGRFAKDYLLSLVAINLVFVLAMFSVPGTPVYDGERLFLLAMPLVAILAGVGMQSLLETVRCRRIAATRRRGLAIGFVALQGAGILVYHPFELSHYNLLVGGLAGAETLGFETTYWGDSVDAAILRAAAAAAPEQPVLFAPNLAPFQAPAVAAASTALRRSDTAVVGWDPAVPDTAAGCRYLIVYRRRADLTAAAPVLQAVTVLEERRRQGVWLSRLCALNEVRQAVSQP